MNEIKVGDQVLLKVGRNQVQVQVLSTMAGGNAFLVKSIASGKEFIMPSARIAPPTVSVERIEVEAQNNTEPSPTAAPKKMTLMKAAVEVLKATGRPMNTREMVKLAVEMGYWEPTACKTPEQTLYGSIFRELKTKESPTIVKSEEKGKFRLA